MKSRKINENAAREIATDDFIIMMDGGEDEEPSESRH